MTTETFKLIAFFLVMGTGLAGGFVSLVLAGSPRSARIFSLGNAFSGGIFLGAGLLHMLPDASDGFASLAHDSSFPWVFLICALGFVLVLSLEKVLVHSHHPDAETANAAGVYPYILMLVLSVHSIIAGTALGAEEQIFKAFIILIAVVAHKGSAAFALGVSLLRGGLPAGRRKMMLSFFSVMTPMGIALGAGLRALLTGSGEQVFESVFDALAAGTFLYVATLDVIEEEFRQPEDRWWKFLLLAFGLGLMAMLAIWL